MDQSIDMKSQPHSMFTKKIDVLLTDIDDTLTDEGQLHAEAYAALWELQKNGIQVVPVTGRPAGWCEMVARFWPVVGVIGENGAFYFRYDQKQKKMLRHFAQDESTRVKNNAKLLELETRIPKEVPGSAVSSDQFCRLFDLAIDFCEDVPALPAADIQKIKKIFEDAGATAKVSSIHVNGWFGDFDKKTQSLNFLKTEFGLSDSDIQERCAFVGDSPNDEPMWAHFQNSFAVANIQSFLPQLKNPPAYITSHKGGGGFVELAKHLLASR